MNQSKTYFTIATIVVTTFFYHNLRSKEVDLEEKSQVRYDEEIKKNPIRLKPISSFNVKEEDKIEKSIHNTNESIEQNAVSTKTIDKNSSRENEDPKLQIASDDFASLVQYFELREHRPYQNTSDDKRSIQTIAKYLGNHLVRVVDLRDKDHIYFHPFPSSDFAEVIEAKSAGKFIFQNKKLIRDRLAISEDLYYCIMEISGKSPKATTWDKTAESIHIKKVSVFNQQKKKSSSIILNAEPLMSTMYTNSISSIECVCPLTESFCYSQLKLVHLLIALGSDGYLIRGEL